MCHQLSPSGGFQGLNSGQQSCGKYLYPSSHSTPSPEGYPPNQASYLSPERLSPVASMVSPATLFFRLVPPSDSALPLALFWAERKNKDVEKGQSGTSAAEHVNREE